MLRVSVTVDDAHVDAVGAVAEALRAQGMQVEQVLDGLGMISGSVPQEVRGNLFRVEGVASVDEELRFQLPPPEAPVQ